MVIIKKYKFVLIGIFVLAVGTFFLLPSKVTKIEIKEKEQEIVDNESNQKDNLEAADNITKASDNGADNSQSVISNLEKEKEKKPDYQLSITNNLVSWGFQKAASRKIDTIIVHSSYDAIGNDPYDKNGLIAEYKSYDVAPHYLIDRKGRIYRLVEDKNIAYHAGDSRMPDGRTGVNNFSIGIEMMNTKADKYSTEEYNSLKYLVEYLKGKYSIKSVLGHKDIASGRKDDPWNFDWSKIK